MKLSDYLAQKLADAGVRHLFMVTGGGAMHLNDSFGHEPRLQYFCNHHEQACAMAAEGYARVTNQVGVINVTTGPGGLNALNGVFGAWTDSIPMLIISGQVKRETCLSTYNIPGLRQLGDQETDIIPLVKSITKYAVMVTDPNSIRYHLEKALFLATSGRPGPCWLDIPIDVQASQIDPAQLPGYDPAADQPDYHLDALPGICREVLQRLQNAARPVIMPGTGVRLAGAAEISDAVIHKLGIPVVLSWTAPDLVPNADPVYCGRASTIGDRAGNFVSQNADVLLVIGSRLNIRQVSYNWQSFARHAYKIQVDADPAELQKPTVKPDLPIHCDAKLFLEELNRQIDANNYQADRHAAWLGWGRKRVARYPVVQERQRVIKDGRLNPYDFMERLFQQLTANDVIVCGNATASVVSFQTAIVQKGQRWFANSGCASMGYDLPAAIGAAVAQGGRHADSGRRVICLAGDGSLQMNIQELQTVKHHQLPIKLFVLNNQGYLSIHLTQTSFFKRYTGESPASGVTFPDFVKVAEAYGLPARRLAGPTYAADLAAVLAAPGPVVCDVMLDPTQEFEPKTSSKQLPDGRMVSAPLEDLYPFLERDELLSNLLIPPQE